MKTFALMMSFVLFGLNAQAAGPSVSGGVPPHPALTTMAIVRPVAGVDYPTETDTKILAVLAVYKKRIPIYDAIPKLVAAQAGIEFPTDSPPPIWTRFQRVLQFPNSSRVPLRLSLQDPTLLWLIDGQEPVEVRQIVSIVRAVAGIDYPTDGPARLNRNFFVIIMQDGSRIQLR